MSRFFMVHCVQVLALPFAHCSYLTAETHIGFVMTECGYCPHMTRECLFY